LEMDVVAAELNVYASRRRGSWTESTNGVPSASKSMVRYPHKSTCGSM
jgi:hypothetical protein